MTTIRIDNVEYEFEKLSENAKASLNMMQFADREILRLNQELALAQTARAAYAKVLNSELGVAPRQAS